MKLPCKLLIQCPEHFYIYVNIVLAGNFLGIELYLLNLLYSSAPDIPKNAKIFSDMLVESSLMNFRVKQVAFFLIFYVSRILVHVIIGISLIILGNVWYERNMKMKRTRFP